MSSQPASSGSAAKGQEFFLRVPKNAKKRYHVMRFHAALNVDVAKWTQVKMERENNLKDFRTEEDLPKFGAGSEFGREQRDEARRKKYGIIMKKYNPEEQPWLLRVGGKAGKKYRGIREGGIAENAAYYVFVKAPDGSFEAFPVDEWYNFTPVQRYKTLNAEEAEEEFGRRDKVLNYFSIMLRKRLKNEEGEEKEEAEEKKQKKKTGKYGTGNSEFKISDMDDWINSSDSESEEEKVEETEAQSKQKNKKKPNQKKKKKKSASDDEALEDSDDGDDEGREVDYISDESSSSEELPEEKTKGELKGVEDEDAIRKMEDSETEEENEEEKKENTEETKEEASTSTSKTASKEKKGDPKKQGNASSSESSSDTSDSDDFDNDSNFHSAMFMQKSKRHKEGSNANSRSNTPTRNENGKKEKGSKRTIAAVESSTLSPPPMKKTKSSGSSQASNMSNTVPSLPRTSIDISADGITEDAVRRYLMRKPMTTTELLHKFKSKKTGLSREQMVNTIAQILKRLNPDKHMIKDKMYLSIKQT